MEQTQKLSTTCYGTLEVDISKDLFEKNAQVQQIIEPMSFDDLINFNRVRFPLEEFAVFKKMCHTNQHNEALTKYDPVAFKMNRYSDIIPFEHTRVPLGDESQMSQS
jgi:protein tyrosine phosphatase